MEDKHKIKYSKNEIILYNLANCSCLTIPNTEANFPLKTEIMKCQRWKDWDLLPNIPEWFKANWKWDKFLAYGS